MVGTRVEVSGAYSFGIGRVDRGGPTRDIPGLCWLAPNTTARNLGRLYGGVKELWYACKSANTASSVYTLPLS